MSQTKQNRQHKLPFKEYLPLNALTATIDILPPPLLLLASCFCKQEINGSGPLKINWHVVNLLSYIPGLFRAVKKHPRVSMLSTNLMYLGSQLH